MPMPGTYAHAYTGERTLHLAATNVRRAAMRFPSAYRAGCQGPDPFYFAHPYGKTTLEMYQLAGKIHTQRVGALMAALLRHGGRNQVLRSYAMGFLTHYALDVQAHPYVYYKSCNKHHVCFETQLDNALLQLHDIPLQRVSPAAQMQLTRPELATLNAMWQDIGQAVHGEDLRNAFVSAYDGYRQMSSLRFDPTNTKHRLVSALERLAGTQPFISLMLAQEEATGDIDYLNLERAPWEHAWADTTHRDSVPELIEAAAQTAARMQQAALEAVSSGDASAALAVIGSHNFDTGLPDSVPAQLLHKCCVYQDLGTCRYGPLLK